MKTPWLRPRAERDLIDATRHYRRKGGEALAARVFDAALDTLALLAERPAIGSPRLGQLCDIPDLRTWPVKGFPLVWLYFEAARHLDVVRLLGKRRDLAALLTDDDFLRH